MGILDKLMFWKKKDNFDFDSAVNETMASSDNRDAFSKNPGQSVGDGSSFNQQNQQQGFSATHNSGEKSSSEQPSAFQQAQQHMQQQPYPKANTNQRELELLSSKLDTIKAILNSLDQRIANLEKVAGVEKKTEEKLW